MSGRLPPPPISAYPEPHDFLQNPNSRSRAAAMLFEAQSSHFDPDYTTLVVPYGVQTADWSSVLTFEICSAAPQLWHDPIFSAYGPSHKLYHLLENHIADRGTDHPIYRRSRAKFFDQLWRQATVAMELLGQKHRALVPFLGNDPSRIITRYLRPDLRTHSHLFL